MRNLIAKDFALLRSGRLLWMGLIYTTFILFDRGESGSFSGTSTFFLIFVTYIFVNYLNSYDYMYHGDLFLNAFPVSRSEVVESRYASVLILSGGFFCLAYGLRAVLWVLGYPYAQGIVSFPQLTIVILAVALYYGLMLPLYFKLGYERLRWLNFIALITVSVVSSLLGILMLSVPIFMSWWVPLISAAIGAVILFASLQVAIKNYEGRDF